MCISSFLRIFNENKSSTSIIWNEQKYTYAELLKFYNHWENILDSKNIRGQIIGIQGDFTPNCIALLLAGIKLKNIIVPFNNSLMEKEQIKIQIARPEIIFSFDENDNYSMTYYDYSEGNKYYNYLITNKKAGLVLFTSGTSGQPKAAVHDFCKLLKKFSIKRKSLLTINFLLFDHWGGLNTMFHTLSNAGTILTLKDRSVDSVCKFIEKYHIELLPVSPTFLNLMLISEAYKRYNLDSLKIISYGTEPMYESTLYRLTQIFPSVIFQQTYGLIELGVLRTKSLNNNSLWVKIGGEGYDIRVIDGILQIKADSAMLGYINAPNPFTDDGYFITGDAVEIQGDYLKILGRKSELINVGGEKVYPTEVENVIRQFNNVADVTVYSEKNPITGQIVCAKIKLHNDCDKKAFVRDLKIYCQSKLALYKVPVKISFESSELFNHRFKKNRDIIS